MKVALCMSGFIGNAEKWLGGEELDYHYGHKYISDSILNQGDIDVFIHSYSTKHEDGINDLYKPVKSVFQENPDFKLRGVVTKDELPTPYAYCLKSMWYSRKRSVELVLEHEKQNGFKYDLVLLTRFDIALFRKFEFEKYDSSKLYIAGPILYNRTSAGLLPYKLNDMYFMANSENLKKVVDVYDTYETIAVKLNNKWPMESVSSHTVIAFHLMMQKFFQNKQVECLFDRPWQSSREWSGDIRFLRSDPDVKIIKSS